MSDNRKVHLWIPDEEVLSVPHKPTGRSEPRDVIPFEHGKKLSAALESVLDYYNRLEQKGSLSDELIIFKVQLPDGEKFDNKERQRILQENGLSLKAVKDRQRAIVTATREQFQQLRNRVTQYQIQGRYQDFQYIELFEPLTILDKQSSELRKISLKPPERLDIQMLLIPNLVQNLYDKALSALKQTIADSKGTVVDDHYYLSDGTPVIRAVIPSSALNRISSDDAVYRVEETRFFSAGNKVGNFIPAHSLTLNPDVGITDLPVVVILDTGIQFPDYLKDLVISRWIPQGVTVTNSHHGTQVASKAVFGHDLGDQVSRGVLTPRVRVYDVPVIDGSVAENVLIKRIQSTVEQLADTFKVFNLSANATVPIEGDEISIIGYELDILMQKYSVQFVISAGNHTMWKTTSQLEDILDDDDTRIAAPADSMLGIAVGSVVGCEHDGSMSKRFEIAPYSRRGPGFAGFQKPDLSTFGATILVTDAGDRVPLDVHSVVMTPSGQFVPAAGTSYTAPVVAGDLARILAMIPTNDVLLAKALLYHGVSPVWDEEDVDTVELDYIWNIYGRGISNPEKSTFSSSSRVTFVRTGELNRLNKERVKFLMPSILAAQPGRNSAKVTVTCVSRPPIDRTKGTEYLGAYVSASLHKVNGSKLPSVNPSGSLGRDKWDSCHHFYRPFSRFEAGDWQVWLQLFSRWDLPDDVNIPYALAITIEDLSGALDIYTAIINEAQGRFMPINTINIPIRGRVTA